MSQGNLLVVDDELSVRDLFKRYLSELGYQVKVAPNAEKALRIAKNWPVHVALVDLRLPGMDGLSFIRKLKKTCPDAQTVIVSGAGELEDAIEAIKEQVCYYLRKPPALTELDQTVRLAVDRYELGKELEASERKLRDQKAFVEQIIENVNLFVIGFDLEHRINLFNRLAETVSEYRKDEVMGKPASTIFHNHALPFLDTNHRNMRTNHDFQLNLPFEFPIRTKSGRTIDFLWTESRVTDNAGNMTGWIGFGEDLTEKKALENKLVRSEKLAATGRLAAAIAHEINNPLQGIKSNFNLIASHLRKDFNEKFRISLVSEGLNRIAAIVHRLLDVHRPRSVEIESVDLPTLIYEIHILLESTLQKAKIQFEQKWPPNPLPVQGAYSDLHQAFLNLMLNSIEAIQNGGTISIEMSQTNERATILISDTGQGIAQGDLDYIFEPFFTTKKNSKGVGLGLSVVRGILESLDGEIEVLKTNQDGTCFQIILPTRAKSEESQHDFNGAHTGCR
jgi:PAS domain S-box-containing protein